MALLIGIDDSGFAPLASCLNDAVAMHDLLVELGIFQAHECTLMTSPQTSNSVAVPTRDAILAWLWPLYDGSPPLERLLVYFAGHGLSVRLGREANALRTALVPAGVHTLRNAGGQLIDLDELVGRFARRGAREQVWIIDACRRRPDGVTPNVATIGWDAPEREDPRDAFQMAQAVLNAVAPLGEARSVEGGHGLLTRHLLDGLACRGDAQWGASGQYNEANENWLITPRSLWEYARRRISDTVPAQSWERAYYLPQLWTGELEPGHLRDAGSLPHRPLRLFIEPAAAAASVRAGLSISRNTVAEWPPSRNGEPVLLHPSPYHLKAMLMPGVSGWQPPRIDNPIIDVRTVERFVLTIEPVKIVLYSNGELSQYQPPDVLVGTQAAATVTEQPVPAGIAHDETMPFKLGFLAPTPRVYLDAVEPPPTLRVHAVDLGASVRLTKLSGNRERRNERVNSQITLTEGIWRVEVMLGSDVIAVREEDFVRGNTYEIAATAQITPALAALYLSSNPEQTAAEAARQPPPPIAPSESIGPMQGAIVPTLLPMLALKPFDNAGVVLHRFNTSLNIPKVQATTVAPAAFGVAFDGTWDGVAIDMLAGGTQVTAGGLLNPPIWRDKTFRISLYCQPYPRLEDGIVVTVPFWGRLDVAAPRVPNYCTVAAATLWGDGRWDLSINLFVMPPGSDEKFRPGRLQRALAIAARLYRGGASLDDLDKCVFAELSSGSWGDPVLGALAWFGNNRRRGDAPDDPERQTAKASFQTRVSGFMQGRVPDLTDTKLIAALGDTGGGTEAALDVLLDDPALGQPVLAEAVSVLARHAIARDRLDHWSVARFQQLPPDAVFNAVRLPLFPRGPGAAPQE